MNIFSRKKAVAQKAHDDSKELNEMILKIRQETERIREQLKHLEESPH